jgi:UDP-glucose 4-epimerase
MVILVTGGSGFIGSHIVDKLVGQGFEVRVFDKYKPRRDDVQWFKGDLLNGNDTLEACRDVETVYHLAAIADVNVALSHFELCLMTNEMGTMNFLEGAVAKEVERVILASSTWVYGKSEGTVNETSSIPLPDHIYTKTKIGQEQLVHAWHEHYGLSYTILRFGIPYGPRMRSNMVIAIFVRRAMRHEPITVFGDGDQGRCFIYVEDLAEGNVAALNEKAENEIFNLAGSEFVSINQLVKELNAIFGDLDIRHEPSRPEDFRGTQVSIKKAKEFLGWKPRTLFQEGLRKYVKHVQGTL